MYSSFQSVLLKKNNEQVTVSTYLLFSGDLSLEPRITDQKRVTLSASAVAILSGDPMLWLSCLFVHDYSEFIEILGLKNDAPFYSPHFFVPFQYSGILQDNTQVG